MMIAEFEKHKGIITELLRGAVGQIHMSFDLWTSRNPLHSSHYLQPLEL
jgi:hypothetical protein